MCCQTPTPPQSIYTLSSSLTPQEPPPLERQFFRAPTVLTGILPGNRAQASGLWRCFRSFGPGSLTNASTTLPYESWLCLLCRRQPCLSTGSSLPTCQLTCNMPSSVSHTAGPLSAVSKSKAAFKAQPSPTPTSPQQGQGRSGSTP